MSGNHVSGSLVSLLFSSCTYSGRESLGRSGSTFLYGLGVLPVHQSSRTQSFFIRNWTRDRRNTASFTPVSKTAVLDISIDRGY